MSEYGPRPKRVKDIDWIIEQKYICDDPEIIKEHELPGPFECCIHCNCGYQLVTIELFSRLSWAINSGRQVTAFTFFKFLRPVIGETWDSDIKKFHKHLDEIGGF